MALRAAASDVRRACTASAKAAAKAPKAYFVHAQITARHSRVTITLKWSGQCGYSTKLGCFEPQLPPDIDCITLPIITIRQHST